MANALCVLCKVITSRATTLNPAHRYTPCAVKSSHGEQGLHILCCPCFAAGPPSSLKVTATPPLGKGSLLLASLSACTLVQQLPVDIIFINAYLNAIEAGLVK